MTANLQPHHRPREIARGERRQIVDALADADEMHRQAELGGDRHQDAAARGAVELGHDQSGDARDLAENLDLAERVLPDGRVEHQQHRVRRGRLDLAHDAHHFFQFAHQLGAVLQAAGGIDQDDIDALRLGGGDARRRQDSPRRRPARCAMTLAPVRSPQILS